MMDEKRLAMLGDREAQNQFTERGELLPCPKCHGISRIQHITTDVKMCMGFAYAYCEKCDLQTRSTWPPTINCIAEKKAISDWNTRAPILSLDELKRLEGME